MSVGADKLIRMAEQISANVSIDDDNEQVGKRLAQHMQRFWDPRMRAEFLSHARAAPGALSPPLRAAAQCLQETGESAAT